MNPRSAAAILALLCLLGTAEAAEWSRWFSGKTSEPSGATVYVCHGFGCRSVAPVTFSAAELASLASPLRAAGSAAAERQALSLAVQRYEQVVGARIGTRADLPGIQGWGKPNQMDCIDEATNTASLLILLQEHGFLRFHEVRSPTSRGFFLDGRYPHATAVMQENGGEEWSVDSWPRANGEPPVLMPMRLWRKERSAALN